MKHKLPRAIAPLALALVLLTPLGGCHRKQDRDRTVTAAWVRVPAVPGLPGAAYFTLHGNGKPDRLEGIQSALVQRIELHEDMGGGMAGGMTGMKPLSGKDIPASGDVSFAPGGDHAMLIGIDRAIVPGTAIPLRFVFASGRALEVEAKSVGPGRDSPYPAP